MNKEEKSNREESLQHRAESGTEWSSDEEKAYFLVFRALNKQVEFPLSDSFAERVSAVVAKKQKFQAAIRI